MPTYGKSQKRVKRTVARLSRALDFLPLDSDFSDPELGTVCWFSRAGLTLTQAWFRRRSTNVLNITDELNTEKEGYPNQFGTAVLAWRGKINTLLDIHYLTEFHRV